MCLINTAFFLYFDRHYIVDIQENQGTDFLGKSKNVTFLFRENQRADFLGKSRNMTFLFRENQRADFLGKSRNVTFLFRENQRADFPCSIFVILPLYLLMRCTKWIRI
ncbi:hypothetical protein BLX88_10585 [Bacillus obstructivus]|nr:hypothetical protein BLX88_10585 [Bacillus obstructivus]